MAEVDTSSYPKPQAAGNPLDSLLKVGQLGDVLGNLEVGKSVQGALDPNTGEIDRNKLASGLGSTVAGSMKAIPTLDALEKLKQAGFDTSSKGLDTLQKRYGIVSAVMGSVADMENPTIEDVKRAAKMVLHPSFEAEKHGLSVPVIMEAINQFRGPDGKPLPSAQIKEKATQMMSQSLSAAQALEAHAPRGEWIDQGGQKTFVPIGSKLNPKTGTAVPMGAPPTTPVKNPTTGQDEYLGTPTPVPGGGAVGPTGKPVIQATQNVISAVPGPVTNPQTGEQLPDSTFNTRFNNGFTGLKPGTPSSNAPGFDEAAKSEQLNNVAMANRITTAAQEVPATKAAIMTMRKAVDNFTPGPGADYTRLAKSFVNSNLVKDTFDPASIASQEEFNKLTYDIAQRQFQALGGTGTDSQLTSTMHTSPNELMSRYGIKGVTAMLLGNEDAKIARNKALIEWRKSNGPNTIAAFTDNFNNNFDPRVFQFKYLTQDERNAQVAKMTPEERKEFAANATYARKKGWVTYGGKDE